MTNTSKLALDRDGDAKNILAAIVAAAADCYTPGAEHPHPDERASAAIIQDALLKLGFEVSLSTAASVWETYSEAFQAGWLDVPMSESDVAEILVNFANSRLKSESDRRS